MRDDPNILFLLFDCLGSESLYSPSKTSITPNLDGLIKNGFNCLTSVSSAVTTTACVASIFTGSYSMVHGIKTHVGHRLNPQCTTLAEALKRRSYHTRAEVTGPLEEACGLDRGFDRYSHRNVSETFIGTWGDRLLETIQCGELREPWFLFLHLWELHYPRRVSRAFRSRRYGATPYARALSSLDWKVGELLKVLGGNTLVVIHGDHGEDFGRSVLDEKMRVLRRNLLYLLKRFVFRRSSRIRFRINRLYNIGHGYSLKENLIRVPLSFYGDGVFPSGVFEKGMVRQIDILPSLLGRLGVADGIECSGVDILESPRGAHPEDRYAYLEACGVALPSEEDWIEGLRTDQYKYLTTPYNRRETEELYDIVSDPGERRNLAIEMPDIKEHLARNLERVKREHPAAGRPVPMSETEKRALIKRLRKLGYY